MQRRCLLVLCLLAIANVAAAEGTPHTLALISLADESQSTVDLVMAELSKDDSIALVERDQFTLITKEQALALTSHAVAARIKALAGPRFEAFLARNGVDPDIFGFRIKGEFLTTPGDIQGGKLWENFIRAPSGWILFDP